MEIWKDIKGYEKLYQVSSLGRIKSIKRKIIMKSRDNGNGYLKINLCKNNKYKTYYVHRLVMLNFNPIKNKLQINHIDCNKLNNYVNNLEWATPKENMIHALKNNLIKSGEALLHSKLNKKQVRGIRKLYSTKRISQSKLGQIYNVSQSTICEIINNKRWVQII